MRVGWVLLLGMMLGGCAATGELRELAADDVTRALEIARAANDPAGAACAMALLEHVAQQPTIPTPLGAFSTVMFAREARRRLGAGVSESVHNACAPMILDAEETIAKLGLMAVPGGGIAGKLLPR